MNSRYINTFFHFSALKAVMASSKRNTGNRARGNSTTGGGAGGAGGPSRGTTGSSGTDRDRDGSLGGGGSIGGSSSNTLVGSTTRARGISDVRGNMAYGSPNDSSGFGGGVINGSVGGYGMALASDGRTTVLSSPQRNR